MKTFINQKKTLTYAALAAVAVVGLGVIQAQAQSVDFTFADGTSDGWTSGGFSAGTPLTVTAIGGNNYVFVPTGSFQSANVGSGYTGNLSTFNAAMNAALLNPSGYDISYNWYVNTTGNTGTFLQLGTYLNTSGGYYAQDYSIPNEVQLSGAQLAGATPLSGTVTFNLAAVFANDPNAATETSWRLGLIVNGNGTGNGAYFNDITVSPVATPEPASLAVAGLGGLSMLFLRRRKA